MGFVRKITGVQAQIDAANANADAQIKATKQAAADQQRSLMETAKAAADQQALLSQRNAASIKAEKVASTPLDSVDVSLDAGADTTGKRKATRASFGRNYGGGTGVSI